MQSLAQMMRGVLVVAVLLILGLSRAKAAAVRSNEITLRRLVYEMDIDNLIDENIETIRDVAGQLDPLELDDINFSVLNVPLIPKAYVLLHTGWAQNLAKLRRAGKCNIRYTGKKLDVDLNLGWDDLVFDYRYLIKALGSFKGDLHGQMTKMNVHIAFEVNFKNYHITLRALDLQNKGEINISLEGHWLTDLVSNYVIKKFTTIFNGTTLKTIREKMHLMIMHRIDEINFKLASIVYDRELFRFVDRSKESTNYRDYQQLISNAILDKK